MKLSDFIADLELLRAKHGDDIEVTIYGGDDDGAYVPASTYLVTWRSPAGAATRKEVQIEPENQ